MILLLHIGVALFSLAFATGALFKPSRKKLNITYALTALTLTSGTYLVVNTHAPILQACTTGLLYTGLVCLEVIPARRKLSDTKN